MEHLDQLDAVFACLARSDRRRVVGVLYEQAPEAVSHEELVSALVDPRNENTRGEVSNEARQRVAVALEHEHIPTLTAAGLVERSASDDIALAEHPAFDDPGVRAVIADDVPAGPGSLDALFRALADHRRRFILDVLSHQFGPIHLETLARELGTDGQDVAESEVPMDDVARELIRLHHVDLPHLSEAGVIEYDADEETVEYSGHPRLRVPWMHSVLQSEFRQCLTGESEPSGIGEIDGRRDVISYGQSLCDRADDELFCMFTDTGLLEAGCLTRIRDASRRGADVYLGTRDPDVREYVRENAPDVVLWEPNTDWLNLPAAGDRVGRLLLADREAVMLATLLDQTADGHHGEQAMVGEGEHNTLVTMLCQLLGPHLEEVDKYADDVAVRLPL